LQAWLEIKYLITKKVKNLVCQWDYVLMFAVLHKTAMFALLRKTAVFAVLHKTCLAGYALSYSLAHLAVPYGGRQDARLEPKYIQNLLVSGRQAGSKQRRL
jgi:hypothetical protein